MKVLGVIPARYGSTRFPGKPLAAIDGKPMILRVYEAASKAELLDDVVVATDDERILNTCLDAGARAIMTDINHASGSDRVAEVAEKIEAEIYVNIQGDEPLLPPENIDRAVKPFLTDDSLMMATLKTDLKSYEDLFNINMVKVVTDKDDFALYFSRLPIPFCRESGISFENCRDILSKNEKLLENYYYQIGLYVFRRDFLFKFTSLPPSRLEGLEKLEQLRALENGYRIKVVYTDKSAHGVDSEEDLIKIQSIIKEGYHGN